MIHQTYCRMCNLGVEIEMADDCPITFVDAWKNMATCDRCADYRHYFYQAMQKAYEMTLLVIQASPSRKAEIAASIKPKLETLLRFVTKTVGEYHRRVVPYDTEFANQILADPKSVRKIMWGFEKRVRKGLV